MNVSGTEVGTEMVFPFVAVVAGIVVHTKLVAVLPVVVAVRESGLFRHTAVSRPALTVHCDFAENALMQKAITT